MLSGFCCFVWSLGKIHASHNLFNLCHSFYQTARSPPVAAWEKVVEQLFSPIAIFPPETKTSPNLGLGPHLFFFKNSATLFSLEMLQAFSAPTTKDAR